MLEMIWGRITIVQKNYNCQNTVILRNYIAKQIIYLFGNFQCKYYLKKHEIRHLETNQSHFGYLLVEDWHW